jgi:hypothetical protein
MAKFHINNNGEAGACSAVKGNCPFGGPSEHFTSASAAREAYEKKQTEESDSFSATDKLVEEFGKDSAAFRSWGEIHRDFKTNTDGVRRVMVMSSRGSTLIPWQGPKALERYEDTLKKIEVMEKQQKLAANPPSSFAGYTPAMNPIDIKKIYPGERYYDLEGTAYVVESVENSVGKVTMNPLDDNGNPLGTPGKGVIPVTDTRNAGRFYKLVSLNPNNYVDTVGGTSQSKAVKDLPAAGRFDKAVSAVVQYRDEADKPQTMELIAQIDRLSDKRKILLARQLWTYTGQDPKRFEDATDEQKLHWANQRIMRRSNLRWTNKDGYISYQHDQGGGSRDASSMKLVEI